MNKKVILWISAILIILIVGVVIFLSVQNTTSSSTVNNASSNDISSNDNTNPIKSGDTNILIAYYSNSGNTKAMAEEIQNQTGADIFKITRVSEYSNLTEEEKEEIDNNERPEVANMPENLDKYDTIFIGYPIWNSDLPPIINTFLEKYNFDGKTVIPFCTHGGSGLAGTQRTIANKLSNSTVITNAFSLSRTMMETASTEVESWLKEINVIN